MMKFCVCLVLLTVGFQAADADSVAPPSSLKKVTVTVTPKTPLDMSKTQYSNRYCEASGVSPNKEAVLTTKFAADVHQCLSSCNRNFLCAAANYDGSNQNCVHMKSAISSVSELGPSSDVSYYQRRPKPGNPGSECPQGSIPYKSSAPKYTKTFCLVQDKKCVGSDLYRKPQNLGPEILNCLTKCSKIKTCGSVDFINAKCSPKGKKCTMAELVEEIGAIHSIRLGEGEEVCPAGSAPAGGQKPRQRASVPEVSAVLDELVKQLHSTHEAAFQGSLEERRELLRQAIPELEVGAEILSILPMDLILVVLLQEKIPWEAFDPYVDMSTMS